VAFCVFAYIMLAFFTSTNREYFMVTDISLTLLQDFYLSTTLHFSTFDRENKLSYKKVS